MVKKITIGVSILVLVGVATLSYIVVNLNSRIATIEKENTENRGVILQMVRVLEYNLGNNTIYLPPNESQ